MDETNLRYFIIIYDGFHNEAYDSKIYDKGECYLITQDNTYPKRVDIIDKVYSESFFERNEIRLSNIIELSSVDYQSYIDTKPTRSW
jgi:hypothetical protein